MKVATDEQLPCIKQYIRIALENYNNKDQQFNGHDFQWWTKLPHNRITTFKATWFEFVNSGSIVNGEQLGFVWGESWSIQNWLVTETI